MFMAPRIKATSSHSQTVGMKWNILFMAPRIKATSSHSQTVGMKWNILFMDPRIKATSSHSQTVGMKWNILFMDPRIKATSSHSQTVGMKWNILFMDPRIKMIVNLNLLWSEFVETMRRFDLLLHILVTHRLSVTGSTQRRIVSANSLQSTVSLNLLSVEMK